MNMPTNQGRATGQSLPNGMLEDNYPRNMWWIAARGDEVGEKPLPRWLLENPVVLYRLKDDTPVALDDRCPHRWTPLSAGRVVNDQLICPYHGIEFGSDGRCTRIPTQDTIPDSMRVRSYPLVESGAFVWIWMGDPEKIPACDPPVDMSYTADPNWSVVLGYYEVAVNWVLIRENVLDLTHIAYLHSKTFKQDDWASVPDVSMDGDTVIYRQDFDLAPLSPLFCHAMGFSETKPVKREQEGRMPSLAVSFSDWNVHDPEPQPGVRADFLMRGCHIVTPSQRGKTHYFWGAAFDIPDISTELCERTRASVTEAFDEDQALLEKLYAQVSMDPRGVDYPEIGRLGDTAGVRVRQVLQRKLAAEGRSLSG